MESTPISEYLRLQSQDQILLNRILNESESMASLKSMAQDVLDRSGLSLGDHSKSNNWFDFFISLYIINIIL